MKEGRLPARNRETLLEYTGIELEKPKFRWS